MRRRLFNLAAGASLILCLATLGLWVRGYWVCDSVYWYVPATMEGVHVVKFHRIKAGYGVLIWGTSYMRYSAADAARPPEYRREPPFTVGWRRFFSTYQLGFQYGYGFNRNANRYLRNIGGGGVATPLWAPLGLFAVTPALWMIRRRRDRRRRSHALCASCGYDLRATPDRCPECGTVPAPVAR